MESIPGPHKHLKIRALYGTVHSHTVSVPRQYLTAIQHPSADILYNHSARYRYFLDDYSFSFLFERSQSLCLTHIPIFTYCKQSEVKNAVKIYGIFVKEVSKDIYFEIVEQSKKRNHQSSWQIDFPTISLLDRFGYVFLF
jgi:hypothetical protein